MSLDEEDKDALIKALTKAIAAYEENRKLKKFIKQELGIDVEKNKNTKKKRGEKQPQQTMNQPQSTNRINKHALTNKDMPDTVWSELAEGDFEEKLDDMINEVEDKTNNQQNEEKEGEENG